MSKITDILQQVYEPFCAIIAYKAEKGASSEEMFYLEQHSILKDGSMGAGKPLKKKTLVDMMSVLSKSNTQIDSSIYGAIPDNVLYCDTRIGREKLVWYHKPEERFLFFKDDLDIPNGAMVVPGLVYVVQNKKLAVYAFKGNKPKSNLFFAPFMNTTDTYVCLGNSKVAFPEERTFENIMGILGGHVLEIGVFAHPWREPLPRELVYNHERLYSEQYSVSTGHAETYKQET